jgi:hypothetical protein
MKSFKIREGNVEIDGVRYQSTPCETKVRGKFGNILSINIEGKGQFFPVYGTFNDGSIPTTDDNTGIVEEPIQRLMGERTTKVRRTKAK